MKCNIKILGGIEIPLKWDAKAFEKGRAELEEKEV